MAEVKLNMAKEKRKLLDLAQRPAKISNQIREKF